MNELNNKKINRKYFTQIPNLIADCSFANVQALYLQIKRHAGEDGVCFATEKTLMKKLHIGKKAFDIAKKYLLSENFIVFAGKKLGKTRPINTYKVVDIWGKNFNFYEKISAQSNISIKDKFQRDRYKFPKQYKITLKGNVEEEPFLIKTRKEERIIHPEEQEKINETKKEISELVKKLKINFNDNDP
jgi:hypothetical protein